MFEGVILASIIAFVLMIEIIEVEARSQFFEDIWPGLLKKSALACAAVPGQRPGLDPGFGLVPAVQDISKEPVLSLADVGVHYRKENPGFRL